MIYDFIIQNREILKIFYGLMVVLICLVIVLRTDRLFRISLHQGIRYFRNAFFFFSLAFLIRYIMGSNVLVPIIHNNYFFIVKVAFEFFLIMAGFFLLYSLLWKKIEVSGESYPSSLFNPVILIFYLFTFSVIFLDLIWNTYSFMFVSQIILFSFASAISFVNYENNSRRHKFLKFYFIAMIFSLIAWVLNALAALLFNWNPLFAINISIINLIIFLIFLLGGINVTKSRG